MEPETTDDEQEVPMVVNQRASTKQERQNDKRKASKDANNQMERRACSYRREPQQKEKKLHLQGTCADGRVLRGKMRATHQRTRNTESRKEEYVITDDPAFNQANHKFKGETSNDDNVETYHGTSKPERRAI